tara:strand:- start:143 stop:373 length:231 start_codon:yes stop_codon:yes gene_type:complete
MEASVLVIMSLLCVTFLMIGGIIGWLAQQNNLFVQSQQIAYTHPEMYDENGNIIPDEIVAVRFENDNESQEDDDED